MPRVFSYLRFSRPEQMQGDSQRRQLERTAAWAERQGHSLDTSLDLRDLGVSAFRSKNASDGRLGLFLECVEQGRVQSGDFLVLENLDRLSRDDVFNKALPILQQIIGNGVSIVTLEPERIFSATTVKDFRTLFEMIFSLSLANEESRKRSDRVSEAWKSKRKRIAERKLTTIAPKWLKAIKDERGHVIDFDPIDERVAIVKRIFNLASDGHGYDAIAKGLNSDGIATWGRSKFWHRSYVAKILANRSVLGEFQPHTKDEEGRRVAIGDPVCEYFPQVISEPLFYSVQSTNERPKAKGRHSKRVSNLFTGIVKDARGGGNMVIVDKSPKGQRKPHLVASGAQVSKQGAVYLSFPYAAFEQAVLVWAWDLKLGDILPRKAKGAERQLAKAEGELEAITYKISKAKERAITSENFEAFLDLLEQLQSQRKALVEKVERLKLATATTNSESIDQTKELIERLRNAGKDAIYSLRLKLRTAIQRMVDDIVLLVIQVNNDRVAIADIRLRSGERRSVVIQPGKRVDLPEDVKGLDIRNWAEWPEHLQASRFEVVTSSIQRMIDLERQGLTRTEIAEECGCSKTQVSRTLNKFSKRKAQQKPSDHPWLMTWHKGGNGWVKGFKGKRHFVGMGKLADEFPDLVKARTAKGSWRAANAWWEKKLRSLDRSRAAHNKRTGRSRRRSPK